MSSVLQFLKAFWSYLQEEICINVIPTPDRKIRVLKFRRIIPFLSMIIILTLITSFGFLYKYYQHNYLEIIAKKMEVEAVQEENQLLKNRLYDLNLEAKKLEETLLKLKHDNDRIKGVLKLGLGPEPGEPGDIPLSLEFQPVQGKDYYSWELPRGSSDLNLTFMDSEQLLRQTRMSINNIKQELPNLEVYVKKHTELLSGTPTIWPLADNGESFISSRYGWRDDPFNGQRDQHEGLDIGIWYNTPVLATADGRVSFVGWSGGYGRLVIIEHNGGFETRYGHLNGYKVKKGQTVKRGQVVALSGNSGRSTGPHLHYEVRKDGVTQNPGKYIGN